MRHVTIRQLRIFSEVLRCGSFAGAAQALHLTPPAVTLQMKQLEEKAGMPLLERSSARLEATAAGVEVANAAQRVELAISECADAIGALRGLKGGRVSIGVVSTAKYFAPHALGAFSRAYPSVEIRLEVGNRSSIIAALEANTLDLALTGRPPNTSKSIAQPLANTRTSSWSGRIIRGRAAGVYRPSVLADETFLRARAGSGTRNLMERFFAESRVTPHIGMEMSSNETIKQAGDGGVGHCVSVGTHRVGGARRPAPRIAGSGGTASRSPVVHREARTAAIAASGPGVAPVPHRRR